MEGALLPKFSGAEVLPVEIEEEAGRQANIPIAAAVLAGELVAWVDREEGPATALV